MTFDKKNVKFHKVYKAGWYKYPVTKHIQKSGACKLEVWISDSKMISLVSQLDKNSGYQGISVTNAAESIANHIYENQYKRFQKQYNITDSIYVEHYPERGALLETYDLVYFEFENDKFIKPKWEKLGKDGFLNLIKKTPDKAVISISKFRNLFFKKAFHIVNDEIEFQLKEVFDEVVEELKNKK
jgi:hypothetical protein